jgi:hypothetical protein
MKKLTYAELNLRLVQHGVRPAWQSEMSAAELKRLIKMLGMEADLHVHHVYVKGPHGGRVRIVTKVSTVFVSRLQTHKTIGHLLGLPCSSELAWMDPAACYGFSVEAVPAGACKDVSPQPGLYVTSFWCRSQMEGMAWVRKLVRDARDFERDFLKPRGLRLVAHLKRPIRV